MKTYTILVVFMVLMMLWGCSRDEPVQIVIPPIDQTPTAVKINEIYARGVVTDPDWVEIYNPGTVQVSLSGYKIYDTGGQSGTKPKLEFPADAVVPAKGFYVIVTDIVLTINPAGFGLSSGGEEIWMENDSSRVIDNCKFLPHEPTQSYGRYPDGDSVWQVLNTITKGTSNKL